MSSVVQVEVVRPDRGFAHDVGAIVGGLFGLALRTLFVWWAVAVWLPQFGWTYWQLILPVYAIRCLIHPGDFRRQLKNRK